MISSVEFRDQLSRIIQVAVLFVLLLIFWSAAPSVPGGQTELLDGLLVADGLRVVLAAILIGLAVSIVTPLGLIFARYGVTMVGARPGGVRPRLVPAVSAVAEHLAQVVVLVVVWQILQRAVPLLMTMRSLADAGWLPNTVTLVFLGLLLVLIWTIYVAARPLFDELSTNLSERIAVASERKCPRCGAANPVGVGFCGSCGAVMNLAPDPAAVSPVFRCAGCGTDNPPGSHFCVACGQAIAPPAPVPPPIAVAPVPPRSVICASCGAENTRDSRFCASCGQP
ncbi:MAG: zinc ribbon domain-containing protein, partial [Candidatus Dormibacteraceae bacterium]